MLGIEKWKSVVGPKIEDKLMSNIMRSGSISVMPYMGGTFKMFTREVYLVVDMQQRTCTSVTWKMSVLPCAHVCAIIRTMRHDVYEYIDPCFHVSTQQLIYSGQFQSLPTHNCGPCIFNDAFPLDRRDSLFVYLVKNMFFRKDLDSPLTFIYF